MRIYFAGPLFCQAERRFNAALCARLEAAGLSVFLPQRDGVEAGAVADAAARRRAIFATDRDQVYACDAFLFVLDGRVPDEGACVELGLAYAARQLAGRPRPLVGLMTDGRGAEPGGKLNAMVGEALDAVLDDEDALLAWLGARAA